MVSRNKRYACIVFYRKSECLKNKWSEIFVHKKKLYGIYEQEIKEKIALNL